MNRKLLMAFAVAGLAMVAAGGGRALANGANFAGPGPGITGNDTGGIFPYSPAVEGSYKQIAEGYCSRWGRLAKVTSVHRVYGDYVSFVCYDRPGMIH
ncbi:MAG: hypothetical protein WAL80_14580 [Xanthobacteraceae bacterium]|jgi:hypothetical protein